MEQLKNQICPICGKKSLTLTEEERDIPFFGKAYLFSMNCSDCKYLKSDVEATEMHEPSKYTFEIENVNDLKVRIVKSSGATVKIPQMRMTVEPGPSSIGYISNVEGLLNKFEEIIKAQRDSAEDPSVKKSAKNLLKKLWKIKLGEIKLKIIIEDPTGNSAIISKKAKIEKLK